MSSNTNVAEIERWISALGGAALAVYGLRERSVAGAMITAAGGALIHRGASGYCAMYAAAGYSNARGEDTKRALGGPRGVHVEETVRIDRPPAELYRFWRQLENLPKFMPHLVSVRQLNSRRSRWIAKAPAGRTVEWDAEIINEIPNELIGWRTLDNADVISAGSVRFRSESGGHGTEVRVHLQYEPPGGKVGAAVAWMFGQEPSQTIREDLRRFKELMENRQLA